MASWKMLLPDELWNEIEAVFQIEIFRKAEMIRELASIKKLVVSQKEEITKLKVAFADRIRPLLQQVNSSSIDSLQGEPRINKLCRRHQ